MLKRNDPNATVQRTHLSSEPFWLQDFSEKFYIGCSSCDRKLKVQVGGRGQFSKYYFIKCDKCGILLTDKPKTVTRYSNVKIRDLKSAYECLIHDIGHDVYSQAMQSIGLGRPAEYYFNNYQTMCFGDNNTFFTELEKLTFENIAAFYRRKGWAENEGKIDLIVSTDGSYQKRSYRKRYISIFCVSFVFESFTGTCLDYVVVEKCLSNKHSHALNEHCPDKKFYGI